MPREPHPEGARAEWLARLRPEQWIAQGLGELSRAEQRLKAHDRTAGLLGLRRAAGMALNGALSITWRAWGRTYIDHLRAIEVDESVPEAVRHAARQLNAAEPEQPRGIVRLTPPSESARWVDAAKTVMAHAYAVVHGSAGRES
jgi:acyl carrier protein phosphodiesterase